MAKRTARTDPQARKLVADLHAKGLGRNDISRETGISAGTVGNIARDLGLTFARASMSAPATEAKRQDNAALRAEILGRLYREANRKLSQLEGEGKAPWKTITKGSFGVEEVQELEFIPARDYAQVSQSVGYLASHAAKLESIDSPAAAAATSLLTALAGKLGVDDTPVA